MSKDLVSGVIVCSFYTEDEYYRKQGEAIKCNLEGLGVEHIVKGVEIPEGKDWADMCREKIQFLHDVYFSNPGKMVFWIDADCRLLDFPEFIWRSSADLVGFQRGFSTPMRIGYHYRSRFWEPCFIGINATPGGERFIEDALIAEKRYAGKATDDYFFEESWRLNSKRLSFQVIPSQLVARDESKVSSSSLFVFGSSGNVPDFKGKVSQHEGIGGGDKPSRSSSAKAYLKNSFKDVLPESFKPALKKIKSRLEGGGVSAISQEVMDKRFASQCLISGTSGDVASYEKLRDGYEKSKANGAVSKKRENDLVRASAFIKYRSGVGGENPINLSWWVHPAPGNFGDWLSPYVFGKLTGRPVNYSSFNRADRQDHVLGIGSIAKFATSHSTVVGSGVSRLETTLDAKADYRMLRGPYTAKAVESSGGRFDGCFGDPGVVMPLLYQPDKGLKKRAEVGLVRHFSHTSVPLLLPSNVEEFSVLVSKPEDIESFISRLHQYDMIITSAMHVAIVCIAYGIPHRLVVFNGLEEAVSGDGVKYRDFYSGVGLPERSPIAMRRNLSALDLVNMVVDDSLSLEKLQEVRGGILAALENT